MALPARVISVNEDTAMVDTGAQQIQIGRLFVPDVEPGDWVLINTGQAVSRVSEDEAKALRELLKELAALVDPSPLVPDCQVIQDLTM